VDAVSAPSRAALAGEAPLRFRPFLLERWFATREFSAPHVLCASDCETMSVGELLALAPGAADALAALRLGYTESTGHPELRSAIARQYASIGPDDVLVHAGAE
jgi:aspartate/methionine/tyrosine aminotransferase